MAEGDAQTTNPDVLLVESHAADAELVREYLPAGYEIEWLNSGQKALTKLRSFESAAAAPDLMLLDLQLPRWSGFDVLAASRREPVLESVPIVVLSNSVADADRQKAKRLGAERFVTKPMDVDEFERELTSLEHAFL